MIIAPKKLLTEKTLRRVMLKKIARIKAGKVIWRKYRPATEKRRRKYGLGTKYNLYGSNTYSKKSWRMLNSWTIRNNKAVWTKTEAATIYGHHVRRLGFNPIKNA